MKHTWMRTVACLLLAAALAAVLPFRAAASPAYSDLDESHWAYSDMTQAVRLGLLNGTGNGKMSPNATLNWGQALTMVTRAFAGDAYRTATAGGLAWDAAAAQAAWETGLLLEDDFLQAGDLKAPIYRQDMAVLLYRALPEDALGYIRVWDDVEDILSDYSALDPDYQEAVCELVLQGIVRGNSNGTFGGGDQLRRCDGATMLMRTVSAQDSALRRTEMHLTLTFTDASGTVVGTKEADSYVGQSTYELTREHAPQGYTIDYQNGEYYSVSSVCTAYTLMVRPMTDMERQEAEFWAKVDRGEASEEDYYYQDFWLRVQGGNPRKHQLLFGDGNKSRFSSRAEAEAGMVTITVPVWKLSNGNKVASTATFQIHAAIADDVKAIFTEIYNDPEQFPINAVGGYAWRGDSATGEHNCGTAIDINPNENYQVRDGKALAGSFWKPGESPYSITEDGSVMRAFIKYGWSWGGDAWAWDTDPSEGYHDYMHFSYMGG